MHFSAYDRRRFIKTGIVAAAGVMLPFFSKKGLGALIKEERTLKLYNPHTDERMKVCYWCDGRYIGSKLAAINHFFRDFRTGSIMEIDNRLLDLLNAISRKAAPDACLNLISGYRSPETNLKLRQNSNGVARKSLHMLGHAADIRIPGLKTADLRNIAIGIGAGGVGYYPKSDFVHVDIGRVRQW